MGNRLPAHGYFAIDNGCFAHPEKFDRDKYADYITRQLALYPGRCLFATSPDVMGDHAGTLRKFATHADQLRGTGVPVALVAQPGLGCEDVPWGEIDALFLGGGTPWRSGMEAGALAVEAKRQGVWLHMGMVNTARRFRAARSMGCDSVDGTFLKWGPKKNWPRLLSWMDEVGTSPVMVL